MKLKLKPKLAALGDLMQQGYGLNHNGFHVYHRENFCARRSLLRDLIICFQILNPRLNSRLVPENLKTCVASLQNVLYNACKCHSSQLVNYRSQCPV